MSYRIKLSSVDDAVQPGLRAGMIDPAPPSFECAVRQARCPTKPTL